VASGQGKVGRVGWAIREIKDIGDQQSRWRGRAVAGGEKDKRPALGRISGCWKGEVGRGGWVARV
jgi:hypothetical protein